MKSLKLVRADSTIWGSPGVLIGSDFWCSTLERSWEDNKHDISRIPDGEYTCKRIVSPKFGETFEVMDVPNRTEILFHRGNYQADSRGCILVGMGYAEINKQLAITDSGVGFSNFFKHMAGENEFKLTIKSA